MSRHQFEQNNQPSNKPNLVFPDPKVQSESFAFGLEAEFLLTETPTYKPLWHQDLSFAKLNEILESIPFDDLEGDFSPLEVEPPHRKKMPFVVEGYHLPDEDFNMVDMCPKGLEIRTPVCGSIQSCLKTYQNLYQRLQLALKPHNIAAVNLSHHPTASNFKGPMNKRRYDFWLWAMEVMTTYGPDINVSVPTKALEGFQLEDFERKVNYYAPALAAISTGSPFCENQLWKDENGNPGKSYRTFKRSIIAPAVEYHPDEANRFEFKIFEMSPYLVDYENYFLLFLTLVLDKNLKGRASRPERIYQMGEVARKGLEAEGIKKKLNEVLQAANQTLPEYDFSPLSLQKVEKMIKTEQTLADELIGIYENSGSINRVLEHVSTLREVTI